MRATGDILFENKNVWGVNVQLGHNVCGMGLSNLDIIFYVGGSDEVVLFR